MIKIFRQYPIINGFLQLPNNLESEKSKYILAGDGKLNPPTGTSITASAISDVPSSVVVSEIAGTKWVEFDTVA